MATDPKKKEIDPSLRAAHELELAMSESLSVVGSEEGVVFEDGTNAHTDQATQNTNIRNFTQPVNQIVAAEEINAARLLIFTTNPTALEPKSEFFARLLDWTDIFTEIHVIVLTKKSVRAYKHIRPVNNLWLYPTNSKHWRAAMRDAETITETQIKFGNSFRADIVLAFDVYEAGMIASKIAKRYGRPLQIHFMQDIFNPQYQAQLSGAWRRRAMERRVLGGMPSIRVATTTIRDSLLSHYPGLSEVTEIIPTHVDLREYEKPALTHEFVRRFPQYKFFVVFVGPLTFEGGASEAIDAAMPVLLNPSIALVLVGEGEQKQQLQKKAEVMGLAEKVIIAPPGVSEYIALKEASIVLYIHTKESDEQIILKAAAAGVPVVSTHSPLVDELFVHAESAMICGHAQELVCLKEQLKLVVNDIALRRKLVRTAKEDVVTRVEQDVRAYKQSLQDSIERALDAYYLSHANE